MTTMVIYIDDEKIYVDDDYSDTSSPPGAPSSPALPWRLRTKIAACPARLQMMMVVILTILIMIMIMIMMILMTMMVMMMMISGIVGFRQNRVPPSFASFAFASSQTRCHTTPTGILLLPVAYSY